MPVAETPAAAVGEKEEKTLKESESTAAVESTTVLESTALWEAEVVELGSLGQGQTGGPAPEPDEPGAPATLGGGQGEAAGEPKETIVEQEERPLVAAVEKRPAGEERQAGPEAFLPGTAEVGLVITYKTKEEEDLPAIATKSGIPVEALSRTNNLSPDTPLPAGVDLVIPVPVEHLYVLQPGETLWRLARRYEVPPELLMEINQISDVTQLMIGQIIILPKPVDQAVKEN